MLWYQPDSVNRLENDIDLIISRSLNGEASPAEEKTLSDWLNASDQNKQHYEKSQKAFSLAAKYYQSKTPEPVINLDKEWSRFLNHLGKEDNVRTLTPPVRWARLAAGILLVVASGFIINYFISINQNTIIQTTGEIKEVTLPDGSHVTLNRNTSISYTKGFNTSDRKIELDGEAFFDVEHNEQKPFIISVRETTIEVLGTSFNIQGYNTTPQIEVVVSTGLVKFSVPELSKGVTLRAGERGVFIEESKELAQQPNEDVNFLAWKTKKIVFVERSLHEVIESLNKIYGRNITLATQVPDTCLVTVTFDNQDLDAILNVLKITLNLTYHVKDGEIEITHAGC